MWSPAEEDSPCWRLNRAEHISARHDQLAFLSRSNLSPQMPSKRSRYRFRVTSVQHLWKAWSKDEKVEEKCLSKESSTGSHFIISLSLSLSLSYFFILNQRHDELIRFILKVVELLYGEPNMAVGVPNLPISHEEWCAYFSSSLRIIFAITALPLLPSSLSLSPPPLSLSSSLSLSLSLSLPLSLSLSSSSSISLLSSPSLTRG